MSPPVGIGDRALFGSTRLRSGTEPLFALNSVRVTSKETYNGGLFIADFYEFASGPSVWPAFWSE